MQAAEAPEEALDLKVGDVVEVRSAEEILATLDENGEYESLPFMPEMVQYCGKRLTVYKLAYKVCDTLTRSGIRRMTNVVHLSGVRCGGEGHDGCQAACLIYWKHAWLRKADGPATDDPAPPAASNGAAAAGDGAARLLPLLTIASRRPPAEDGTTRYRCQATELLRAAPERLRVRDLRQYATDVRVGNAGVFWTIRSLFVALYNRAQDASVRRLPPRLRFRDGRRWGYLKGRATSTPIVRTDLQPGDLVRVRSRDEIEETVNRDLLNRGMGIDNEMARFCGRTARVARRIDHIIDEPTGRMLHLKNPCIVLEGVICEGAYNFNCPRSITPYWREAWLERIDPGPVPARRRGGEQDAHASL